MSPHVVPALVPLQNVFFPAPTVIPFRDLGLPRSAEEFFVSASRTLMGDAGRGYDGNVSSPMAFRVGRMMGFGKKAVSPLWQQIWETVDRRFFGGASFFRSDGEVRPIEVRLNPDKPFADGDTAKVVSFRRAKGWADYKVSVRMDGIDTLESNQSGKLTRQVQWVSRYISEIHGVPERETNALKDLVRARIVYLGKIAGAATDEFGRSFADIGLRLGPAYMRVAKPDAPDLCDSLDLWDKYGRIIGRIMAGGENQGEDLIAGFIETVLPQIMNVSGEQHLESYRLKLRKHARLLKAWRKERPVLYKILSAEYAPVPSEIFSGKKCADMANLWIEFCTGFPAAKNDLQSMLVFLGLAPPYQKYRGHLTRMDLAAELIALLDGHGLTDDMMYRSLRPSADPKDPYASPVYMKYGREISDVDDIAALNPPDCTGESCTANSKL